MDSLPHAVILPFPAQGHVIPILELSHCLVDRGFKITFVNTEFNHHRIIAALSDNHHDRERIEFVSIPDGLGPGEDRNDLLRLTEGLVRAVPGCLEDLIEKVSYSCMIADQSMAWALAVARKAGLRTAVFIPSSAGARILMLSTAKLIGDGIIDNEGVVKKQEMFQLSQGIPPINPKHLPWNTLGNPETKKGMFKYLTNNSRETEMAEFILCNSFYEIEQPMFTYFPKIVPIGPLLTGLRTGKLVGQFWPEDSSCEAWLDQQPTGSVIYVAFGSFTIFNRPQFEELAFGLELTGRRFLWVVRSDLTAGSSDPYPDGFELRVAGRGRMVGWAPQQRVLAHPSIACFVTHCGWNSTMEGVRNGVRFLCWPYFADQFFDESYICDVWRTGLRMREDESGIVTKERIKSKVEELMGDVEMKARAMDLKEMAERSVKEGGASFRNLNDFVDAIQ